MKDGVVRNRPVGVIANRLSDRVDAAGDPLADWNIFMFQNEQDQGVIFDPNTNNNSPCNVRSGYTLLVAGAAEAKFDLIGD
jgi:hypothetical protein